jgi:hypothetical protein
MSARFAAGDRVKIRRSWSEEDGALGTITIPPEEIQKDRGFTDYFREETTLTGGRAVVYWVQFDISNAQPGSLEGGEYDETELEKL